MDQASKLREMVKEKENKDINSNLEYETVRVIAITSGKGGVGKTSLSVNLAALIAKEKKKVLIIDGDLGLSNVEIMLGISPAYTMRDLIKKKKNIEDVIVKGPSGIDFISGGNGFIDILELSDVDREEILIKMKKLDTLYDIIIIDTGAGISKNVVSFLMLADEVIVVTTTEPTALMDAYSMIKILTEKKRELTINLIVNRIRNIKEYRRTSNIILKTAKEHLKRDIIDFGFVFEDEVVKNTIFKKMPFALYYPNSKATECIRYIVKKMDTENKKYEKSIIEKFKNWFKITSG
ncbi:MAG: MinD/ParA family protein [Fusobacteria bacterium]|nr:MinD/ParA family protein [Fusobacteriota bacterium]